MSRRPGWRQRTARAGVELTPQAFRPVLRGYLLTGETPHYFTNSIAGGAGAGVTSTRPLWWPPTKIAGRELSAYLQRLDVQAGRRTGGIPVTAHVASEA